MNISPWVWVLIVLVVIVILAWWLGRTSRQSSPPEIKAHTPVKTFDVPETHAAVEAAAPAPAPAAAAPAAADDLIIIEGIGPKVAQLLNAAGIQTFSQLAATETAKLHEILRSSGFQMIDPDSWPEQARLAAAGDQAGLQALQDRLKGGR